MSFLKKWKNYSKHTKLSEEWALGTSLNDLSDNHYELDDETEAETFQLKYLGNTVIESARSDEATSDAVKAIISTAKANNKKLQRVNLSISPKGIEMLDSVTSETLMRVSIYKISYCSADIRHGNVFAFVGSEDTNTRNKDDESLVCFAYLCPKRKIAHKVSLTVARSFDTAYHVWQEEDQRNKYKFQQRQNQKNIHSIEEQHPTNDEIRSLLIDFSSEITAEICGKDHRDLLQNTWVSFEDNDSYTKGNLLDDVALWERQLIDCS